MKAVYKYAAHCGNPLEASPHLIPNGATVISVGTDPAVEQPSPHDLCAWLEVDPEADFSSFRRLSFVGTGQSIPENFEVVGSVTQGPFRWHIIIEQE